jgi:hypothetical protein
MFNFNAMSIESEHKRSEMLRRAEQQRLIREIKKTPRRTAKNLPSLNALLTTIRPG